MSYPEKTERNLEIAEAILEGKRFVDVADKYHVPFQRVGRIACRVYRRILSDEERVRYLTTKQIAIEYKERLSQRMFDRTPTLDGREEQRKLRK